MTRRLLFAFALALCVVFLPEVSSLSYAQESSSSLLEKGLEHKKAGELNEAKRFYLQAIPFFEAENDKKKLSAIYNDLGLIAETVGDLEEATRFHYKSLEIDEALGNKEGVAITYHNLGLIAKTRGDLEEADRLYNKSLELHEALNNKANIASNLQ